jgi:hypothetical protein
VRVDFIARIFLSPDFSRKAGFLHSFKNAESPVFSLPYEATRATPGASGITRDQSLRARRAITPLENLHGLDAA